MLLNASMMLYALLGTALSLPVVEEDQDETNVGRPSDESTLTKAIPLKACFGDETRGCKKCEAKQYLNPNNTKEAGTSKKKLPHLGYGCHCEWTTVGSYFFDIQSGNCLNTLKNKRPKCPAGKGMLIDGVVSSTCESCPVGSYSTNGRRDIATKLPACFVCGDTTEGSSYVSTQHFMIEIESSSDDRTKCTCIQDGKSRETNKWRYFDATTGKCKRTLGQKTYTAVGNVLSAPGTLAGIMWNTRWM